MTPSFSSPPSSKNQHQAHIYTLENGLSIYLSPYPVKPQIYASVVVRAGGKQDPDDNTGLAHYLEHIMFKGNSRIGTKNWEKEKPLLEQIEKLFNSYRKIQDPIQRKACYQEIDQLSQQAAQYAIPNEYDKIMSELGCTMTNAYTTYDTTVYLNKIPAHQIENWLEVESVRFKEMTPRLFHTELETVYEEKNKTLDEEDWRVYESLQEALFPKHPYGTKTLIGTVEHLKNPSITAIKNFFNTYYCPNNMAICLGGDLDIEHCLNLIKKYFGTWKANPQVPTPVSLSAKPITPIQKKIQGPSQEEAFLAFRVPGKNQPEAEIAKLIDMILSNGQAGLIDLNLNHHQKLLNAESYLHEMYDYSTLVLHGRPHQGQGLDEVIDLLWKEIDHLKTDNWDHTILPAVINDLEINRMNRLESNQGRTMEMVNIFSFGLPHDFYTQRTQRLQKYNPQDIQNFAKKYLKTAVSLHKITGPTPSYQKVIKPPITKVELNKEAISSFHQSILERKVQPLRPCFVNFDQDIQQSKDPNYEGIYHVSNHENQRFHTAHLYQIGPDTHPILPIALKYLNYVCPEKRDPIAHKKKWYTWGGGHRFDTHRDSTFLNFWGLNRYKTDLWEDVFQLLHDPIKDKQVLKGIVKHILKGRENAKKDKRFLLFKAMVSHALYGQKSPLRNIPSEELLNSLSPHDIQVQLQDLLERPKRLLHYGPDSIQELDPLLKKFRNKVKEPPLPSPFKKRTLPEAQVFFLPYDMLQVEILFLSRQPPFRPTQLPIVHLFNEYFSGSMSSPVFQELRESRALAYATAAKYSLPRNTSEFGEFFLYIGTQADKLEETLSATQHLLQEFPHSPNGFKIAQQALLERIKTQRILRFSLLLHHEKCRKWGLKKSFWEELIQEVEQSTLRDLEDFHHTHLVQENHALLILGDPKRLNLHALEKFGEVQTLDPTDLLSPLKPE
ncbi:MAG: insulinase family protein [Cytophagales bacterium]|nr:insulinase family protein [Cytophagales bacterium]